MCDEQQKVNLVWFCFEMKLPGQPAGSSWEKLVYWGKKNKWVTVSIKVVMEMHS